MEEYEIFKKINKEAAYYEYASFIISYDRDTICPQNDLSRSDEVNNYFYQKVLDLKMSEAYQKALIFLSKSENQTKLSENEKKAIALEVKDLNKLKNLDKEKIYAFMKTSSKAQLAWEAGRKSLDFDEFEKFLKQVIEFKKYYISKNETKLLKGYSVLLDEMEDGFNEAKYDYFFKRFEEGCLPLLRACQKKGKLYNPLLDELIFDIDKQKKLTAYLCDIMGYNNKKGYLGETIHPFTNGINSNDVRTTTNYNEKLLFSNLYSVMHEVGHALYDLGSNKDLNETYLFGGTSSGIHESQSRFYENYLGRSYAFITFIYPKLIELFPEELKDITIEDIYYYVNDVNNDLKRVEADELSYSFHILIRYKIEKMLFHNEIEVKDISQKFDEMCLYYFNKKPRNKKEGCYQDIHWTNSFGYFPTYALGNAYAAMFYHYMSKDINIDMDMYNGDFTNINEWLRKNIHQYGKSKQNWEIVFDTCKENFNINYYINYLNKKFRKIYKL